VKWSEWKEDEAQAIGEEDGKKLYLARGEYKTSRLIGKLCRHLGASALIPFENEEVEISRFEVLVNPHSFKWVRVSNGVIPAGAIVAGDHGIPLYITRSFDNRDVHIGYVSHSGGKSVYTSQGSVKSEKNYEVLCIHI